MSDSTGDFDFTGAVFGAGDDGGFGDAGPSSFFGAPNAGGMGTAPLSIFGADSATSGPPAMGAVASSGTPPPPMPAPGAAGGATVPDAAPAPPVPVTPAPQAPGFLQQAYNWLQGKTAPTAGAPGTGIGGASGAAGTPTPAGVDSGSWDDATATGGSGQSGDLASKLKTALSGMQGVAQKTANANNPGSSYLTPPGWPLGRPPGFGAAPQSRGAQSQGLADLVQTMQQRQAQLQGQYLQGTYQPRYTGGLLGV